MNEGDEKSASETKRGRRARDAGGVLALVPLLVGVTFAALLLPRATPPDSIPMPTVDANAVLRQIDLDHSLAEVARKDGLPDDVRALGSALREFHTLEGNEAPSADVARARRVVDDTLRDAMRAGGIDGLVRLRAVQLETFVAETRDFEKTGQQSAELKAVAGAFVRRLTLEGWCRDHTLLPSEVERRVMFKQMWSAFLALDANPQLSPTLDEWRALYSFYLAHPHANEASREALQAARRGAKDKKACEALDEGERLAVEAWRLDRINKLQTLDPAYPAAYARGVTHFRRGNYGASADAFRDWLRDHPSGPWTLRAQNHLRAAIEADRSSM